MGSTGLALLVLAGKRLEARKAARMSAYRLSTQAFRFASK
jgi:hypothetical protein